ncbi:flagellar basal-body rod protein FlgG [Rhizobiaceae bacterium]|nr:flagellar basal-body rod protein FlgG [Rhizobiaceae bacterium]
MRALDIAATGMGAQARNLDVIAHNIANINTTGFKRARAEFTDLVYQTDRAKGTTSSAAGAVVPEGTHFGLGVRTAAVRAVHIQGQITATGNQLDVALTGSGWFQVEAADGSTVYQRSGAFNTDAQGRIVTLDGLSVLPAITVPQDVTDLTISDSGLVSVRVAGEATPQIIGQMALATFINDAGLTPLGSNLFAQSAASGEPQAGTPGDAGFGTLRQGFLESSNVDPVKEITNLIAAQRGYEMNSKVIQAADDMASVVSRNMR